MADSCTGHRFTALRFDRVHPLKLESSGPGTEIDPFPSSLNRNEDYVDARGFVVQNNVSDDEKVAVSRDASDNLIFKDGVVSGIKTLSDLLEAGTGMSEAAHKIIRHIIHFLEDGPAEDGYREITGTIFPTAIIWYETSAKSKKIYEKLNTWTGINVTTIVRKIYDTDGSTVLATVTDNISYSGIFETSRTRTVS